MKADFRVCLDACVLANIGVADLLLRLAERPRQYLPVWSEEILAEVRRTHVEKLRWPVALADRFGGELRTHFPEAVASDFDHLIGAMENDPKDRHVLAAAVQADAEIILTFNLKDFPTRVLGQHGLIRRDPDGMLAELLNEEPEATGAAAGLVLARANAMGRRWTARDLYRKARLPRFAKAVSARLD